MSERAELGGGLRGTYDVRCCRAVATRVGHLAPKNERVPVQDFRMSTFLSVCRTLNYTRSAAELNITQPAVSQHIAHLEKAYGAKLFSYRGKKLALTPAGELVRDAAATMAHDESVLRDAIAAQTGQRRTLRLGMTLTAGEYVLAKPLAVYLTEHEDVQVRIVSHDTERLLAQLHEGSIDCALVEGFFDKSAYDWRVFGTGSLVGVCAPSHPLAGDEAGESAAVAYDLADLLDQHVLIREKGSGTRAVLEHALAARNLTVESFARVTEVGSINIIKTLVESGYGISFLYEAAVARELAAGTLVRIPLIGRPVEHDITLIRLKGTVFQEDFNEFYQSLRAAAQKMPLLT